MSEPTNTDNLSEEELERLTAPAADAADAPAQDNQNAAQASDAPEAGTYGSIDRTAPTLTSHLEPSPAEPEPLVSAPSPNIGEDPAPAVVDESALNGMGVVSVPAVPGQAVTPAPAGFPHLTNLTPFVESTLDAPTPAVVEGDQGDEHVEAAPDAAEVVYEYGETVSVDISLKDHATVPHSFRVGTEPLLNVLNRWAKHKYGVDLNLLENLKFFVNGNYIDGRFITRDLGLHEGSSIYILYS